MHDLISRQVAINEFDGAKVDEEYCTEYDIGYNDGIDFAVSKLSVLPSAQPTDADIQKMQDIEQAMLEKAYECGREDAQQWIPCSERLPEHGGRYLISALDGIQTRTTVAPYLPRCKAWTMTGRMAYWKVIAWMSLPEPAKLGGD